MTAKDFLNFKKPHFWTALAVVAVLGFALGDSIVVFVTEGMNSSSSKPSIAQETRLVADMHSNIPVSSFIFFLIS